MTLAFENLILVLCSKVYAFLKKKVCCKRAGDWAIASVTLAGIS